MTTTSSLFGQERKALVSAYAWNICWRLVLAVLIFAAIYAATYRPAHYAYGSLDPISHRPSQVYTYPAQTSMAPTIFAVLFVIYFGLYLFKISKTRFVLTSELLSIETGYFGNAVHEYDLKGLRASELEQDIFNRLTGDGTLVLRIASPTGMQKIALKGFAKWDELKKCNAQMNGSSIV